MELGKGYVEKRLFCEISKAISTTFISDNQIGWFWVE